MIANSHVYLCTHYIHSYTTWSRLIALSYLAIESVTRA